MVKMIDEIFDRDYQQARTELNAALASGIKHAARSVGEAFAALNRIEYSAPWARPGERLASTEAIEERGRTHRAPRLTLVNPGQFAQ